ncbi:MAG TPA: RNA polymerase sigma factor [Rhodanobacteraceae bacterium]|nr:RNA polymerase sigma factor [Rhodanobacteraceae bacterium]
MTDNDVHRRIETVWKMEAPRLIAGLARMLRDVGLAEDLAQESMLAALEHWPRDGVPENPGAWLMTAAKRRAIDQLRRQRMVDAKQPALEYETATAPMAPAPDHADTLDDDIGDDVLRLIFVACHPALKPDMQIALTLRMLGGLTTIEIARAFLVPEATVAQRIVRAKRMLAEKNVPFEIPRGAELAPRLASVLSVVYLIFNEGHTATAGKDWARPSLCEEAMRLGRVLAGLAPREPEVHGLLALMEIQASRLPARIAADGSPVLLLDQDRARWDRLLIQRGLAGLERVEKLGGNDGNYALQAAIAACHARARHAADTDWPRIAALYARLAALTHSPVVELNRAVAVSMADGAQAGLTLADAIRDDKALAGYHLLPSVRGDLLFKLGRRNEARREFEQAASLTDNAREAALLRERAAAC